MHSTSFLFICVASICVGLVASCPCTGDLESHFSSSDIFALLLVTSEPQQLSGQPTDSTYQRAYLTKVYKGCPKRKAIFLALPVGSACPLVVAKDQKLYLSAGAPTSVHENLEIYEADACNTWDPAAVGAAESFLQSKINCCTKRGRTRCTCGGGARVPRNCDSSFVSECETCPIDFINTLSFSSLPFRCETNQCKCTSQYFKETVSGGEETTTCEEQCRNALATDELVFCSSDSDCEIFGSGAVDCNSFAVRKTKLLSDEQVEELLACANLPTRVCTPEGVVKLKCQNSKCAASSCVPIAIDNPSFSEHDGTTITGWRGCEHIESPSSDGGDAASCGGFSTVNQCLDLEPGHLNFRLEFFAKATSSPGKVQSIFTLYTGAGCTQFVNEIPKNDPRESSADFEQFTREETVPAGIQSIRVALGGFVPTIFDDVTLFSCT